MFGRKQEEREERRAASEVARIGGGGLVQIVVTDLAPVVYYLFLNGQLAPQGDIESLAVLIDCGSEEVAPTVRATLTRYIKTVTGARGQAPQELFPCVLELVAAGRRLSVTCPQAGSLNGLWIALGMRPDGSAAELSGLQSLRLILADGLLDAKIGWMDGTTEEIFAEPAEPAAAG